MQFLALISLTLCGEIVELISSIVLIHFIRPIYRNQRTLKEEIQIVFSLTTDLWCLKISRNESELCNLHNYCWLLVWRELLVITINNWVASSLVHCLTRRLVSGNDRVLQGQVMCWCLTMTLSHPPLLTSHTVTITRHWELCYKYLV